MYPEQFVQPMRAELTNIGFKELRTSQDVDAVLQTEKRPTLVVVNSICGCAAGKARPAIAMALKNAARPDVLTTVFAGQDLDATDRARSYFTGYRPSSPSIALMRDGKIAFMLERNQIEGRDPYSIAADLTAAFDKFCAPASAAAKQLFWSSGGSLSGLRARRPAVSLR
jgi:putative YphP/YqiW family bacilliredoxin